MIENLSRRVQQLEEAHSRMQGWHFRAASGGSTLEIVRTDGAIKGRFQ